MPAATRARATHEKYALTALVLRLNYTLARQSLNRFFPGSYGRKRAPPPWAPNIPKGPKVVELQSQIDANAHLNLPNILHPKCNRSRQRRGGTTGRRAP